MAAVVFALVSLIAAAAPAPARATATAPATTAPAATTTSACDPAALACEAEAEPAAAGALASCIDGDTLACVDGSAAASLPAHVAAAPAVLDCHAASVWTAAMVGTCDLPRATVEHGPALHGARGGRSRAHLGSAGVAATLWAAAADSGTRATAEPWLVSGRFLLPAPPARAAAVPPLGTLAARLEDRRLDRPPRV